MSDEPSIKVEWEQFKLGGKIPCDHYVARYGHFELEAFRQPESSQWAWAVTFDFTLPDVHRGDVEGGVEEAKAAAIAAMKRKTALA